MTLKFNSVLVVVKVHVHAKFHQAKSLGSWVINSALDFGQTQALIVNVSGTDQAINKRKMVLSTTIFYVPQQYRQVLLRARISYGNSVCLSVCLSRPGMDSRPGEIETPGLHRMIA